LDLLGTDDGGEGLAVVIAARPARFCAQQSPLTVCNFARKPSPQHATHRLGTRFDGVGWQTAKPSSSRHRQTARISTDPGFLWAFLFLNREVIIVIEPAKVPLE
jgi:hypothetical protein